MTRRTTTHLIGSRSAVTAASPANSLAVLYETNPKFRELLLAKLKKGEAVQEEVLEALRLTRYLVGPQEPEIQRLLDLGKSIR
jgi:hypothetical protein